MTTILVNNLPRTTTEDELGHLFAAYGTVDRVQIILYRKTGHSLKYGYVDMPNEGEAQAAIVGLHGALLGGQPLMLSKQFLLPSEPDEHAEAAVFRKPPVWSLWYRASSSGHGCPDPAIASAVEIFVSPPGMPHPVRRALRIPLSMYVFCVILTDPLGWKNYIYEIIGTTPLPQTSGTEPTFGFGNLILPGIPFLVAYERRIRHREIPVYLEIRWYPEKKENIALKGLTWTTTQQSVRQVQKGLKLVKPLHAAGGRPRGDRKFPPTDFKLRYHNTYQQLCDAYESRPHRREVAEALGLDVKTLRRYLKRDNLPFPPF